jgi:hypothetical protein
MKWMTSFIDEDNYRNLIKDTKLSILSANKKTLLIYTFKGTLPTSLGDVNFDSSVMEAQNIVFTVELRYQYFTWERVTV